MPIPKDFLLKNPKEAVDFLEGREGACLHQIAHWAFAAAQGFGVGHIIIGNPDRPVSAFVPKGDMMSNLPKTYAMVSAAGAVAENYFCGRTDPARHRPDILGYRRALYDLEPRSDADTVALWCESYSTVISDLEDCIDLNFDLCVSFCQSDVFLMKHHHVIPTAMFWPVNGRDMRAYINQTLDAFSKEARERALDRLRKGRIYGFQ